MIQNNLDAFVSAYESTAPHALDSLLTSEWYPRRIVEKSRGGNLLELGIGHGRAVNYFSSQFSPHIVIEGSEKIIETYRNSFPESSAELVHDYFESYEPKIQFDNISMGFVLEHVDDPSLILRKYARYLSPGGRIFIAVPNANSMHRLLAHTAGMLEDLKALSEADQQLGHLRYFDPDTLRGLVNSVGLREYSMEGILMKPFTTRQIESLNLPQSIYQALMAFGKDYPEIANSLLMEVGFD